MPCHAIYETAHAGVQLHVLLFSLSIVRVTIFNTLSHLFDSNVGLKKSSGLASFVSDDHLTDQTDPHGVL